MRLTEGAQRLARHSGTVVCHPTRLCPQSTLSPNVVKHAWAYWLAESAALLLQTCHDYNLSRLQQNSHAPIVLSTEPLHTTVRLTAPRRPAIVVVLKFRTDIGGPPPGQGHRCQFTTHPVLAARLPMTFSHHLSRLVRWPWT